ncbi:nitrilase 1 S homeolog [Xenopus laevis]|uniref:Deaminated glutathione amidase n=1 Tax=Xenopus laevis TaxID=8355 RepID=Q66KS6_XENLA|nr:nitrilase 1 S homeolog [Xenopus laevis]AAH78575.1 Nit1 protein [Xenopus laevis]
MAGAHKPLIAVCQMTSTSDKEKNFATCSRLIREAAGRRACMVFLPEAFDYIGGSTEETLSLAESLHGDTIQRYTQLARECGLWLSLGGFHEKGPNWDTDQRISNSHVVVDNTGHIVSVYRKAHLFDVDLQNGVSLRESSSTLPGAELIRPITSPAGKIGLGVCYDLRFPEFSLALAQQGAELLTYPSAFTLTTGLAHWEVLLRARAIETQCYVVAAAQTDRHNEKRTSYGHAMVVDPWGLVIGQCQGGTGICYAEIDIPYMERVRRDMPVWRHRRTDLYGKISFNKPD